MADALITTKLGIPRTRANLVPRPRLGERLEEGVQRKLLLVSAPAGFGKTTLLSEWLEHRVGERAVAWVSLDETDCDPARFLSYLVAALRIVEERIGEGVLAALRSPEPLRIEAVAGVLINDLAAVPRDFVLVLDDYHVIDAHDAQPIHNAIAFLLERLPPNAHLVISSRAVPSLPLAALRARDQMSELGVAELSFTTEEAAAFLRDVMRLDLSAEDVATLEERTEGWVAGLQLAALSMRDRTARADVSRFIASFSGSHRGVLDFLAEEVLGRQPENVREFLLMTSVLDRLTGPLCDALTGHADGADMLERLQRENLFVFALDEERRWYRYHRLFADVLRGRLERERPEQAAPLQIRASAWSEENGLVAEAIRYALSGGDYDLAARLIEECVEGAMERGEGATAVRWLEALPPDVKHRRPRLFVEHAVALMITGRLNDTEPLLQEAERAAEAGGDDNRFLLGFASAVRSWRARLQGDAPEALELARRALSLLPDKDSPVRNYAAVRLGDALRAIGDLATADDAYAEAAGIERAERHVYGRLAGAVLHARVQQERGHLQVADEAFQRALRLLAEDGFEQSPAAAIAHIGMAELRYEWNALDDAERALDRGVELAELSGDVSTLVWAYITSSRVKRSQGDKQGARERASQAERVARDSGADLQIALATSWMARLRLEGGDLAEAEAAAWMVDRMTTARLLHARSQRHEALRLLEDLRETAAAKGRTRDLVEILSLYIVTLWASGKKERAVSALVEALALAAPEGYIRTFLDEGQPMVAIISRVLESRHRRQPDSDSDSDSPSRFPAHYARTLLTALELETTGRVLEIARLPEPLSERESEVLTLIEAGQSNRQIADALFVTVGTVKTHLNNIYRKLGAHSRTQALARAREMNLL